MIDFGKVVNIFANNQALLISGVISTIILSVFGTVVGLFLGVFIAYGKNIKIKPTMNWFKRIGLRRLVSILLKDYVTSIQWS